MSASHFGAISVGTEINYQVARAEGPSARMGEGQLSSEQSVASNFEQYGIGENFLDIIIADASRHSLWRFGNDGLFDGVVADRERLYLRRKKFRNFSSIWRS